MSASLVRGPVARAVAEIWPSRDFTPAADAECLGIAAGDMASYWALQGAVHEARKVLRDFVHEARLRAARPGSACAHCDRWILDDAGHLCDEMARD